MVLTLIRFTQLIILSTPLLLISSRSTILSFALSFHFLFPHSHMENLKNGIAQTLLEFGFTVEQVTVTPFPTLILLVALTTH